MKTIACVGLLIGALAATSASADDVNVDRVHIKNNSAGDANIRVDYDCEKNGEVEAYGCSVKLDKVVRGGGAKTLRLADLNAAIQDKNAKNKNKDNPQPLLKSGTPIGFHIGNGAGKSCKDRKKPDGGQVIFNSDVTTSIEFKITGDAVSGISCHFQKA